MNRHLSGASDLRAFCTRATMHEANIAQTCIELRAPDWASEDSEALVGPSIPEPRHHDVAEQPAGREKAPAH